MHNLFKGLTAGTILTQSSINTNAQVTIGSEKEPNLGSLLDLKEKDVEDRLAN